MATRKMSSKQQAGLKKGQAKLAKINKDATALQKAAGRKTTCKTSYKLSRPDAIKAAAKGQKPKSTAKRTKAAPKSTAKRKSAAKKTGLLSKLFG